MKNHCSIAAALALLALPMISHASELKIFDSKASSTFYTYDLDNLTNGSGLDAAGLHDGDFHHKWMSTTFDSDAVLTFDFGSTKVFTGAKIWNYGTGCCDVYRSVKDFLLQKSFDGLSFSDVGTFTLFLPTTEPLFAGQDVSFSGTAQYLRIKILSNYGEDYSGLSELKFFGSNIPEPATWAMLLLGFGFIGVAMRRDAHERRRPS